MKINPVKTNPIKIKKLAVSYKEVFEAFSPEEKRLVEQEVQYLKVLMNLKKTRKELGLTQAELAKRSQIPRATVTKIENGQRNATLRTMLSLADAMGKQLEISWV